MADNIFRPCVRVICPVCYRRGCKLLQRLTRLRFEDGELQRLLTTYHRDVCAVCKRLNCAKRKERCKPRVTKPNERFPGWWTK